MKAPIETTGNMTSEITSRLTSLRKSHSLIGMAELFLEDGDNYKFQITNNYLKIN